MKRLRQSQQKYEEELVSKGILPHTTDEEIRILAEQRRQQRSTDANTMENVNQVRFELSIETKVDKIALDPLENFFV